jgi:N-acetylneuraminic acid mutarotase
MPDMVDGVSAAVDNKIYMVSSGLTQIYNPKTDKWSMGAPAPKNIIFGDAIAAISATTGVMAPKRIYVYDGYYLQVYNPENDSWTIGSNPPFNRQYGGITAANDTLYLIGGYTDYAYNIPGTIEFFSTNEQYTPFGYGTIPPIEKPEPFPVVTVGFVLGVAAVVVVVAGLLVYFKKHKRAFD